MKDASRAGEKGTGSLKYGNAVTRGTVQPFVFPQRPHQLRLVGSAKTPTQASGAS